MKTPAVTVLGVALLGHLGQVPAQAQEKLPLVVQAELAAMRKTCLDAGGQPMKSPNLLLRADLTDDGLPDFVINQGAFICDGAASLFSGSGGSSMSVYLGTKNAQAVRAFSSGSFDVAVDRAAKPAKLQVAVAGQLCGQRVTSDLPRSEYQSCWRPVAWNDKERKLDFAPVSQVKFIP